MGRSLSSSSGKPRATTRVVRRHERSVFRTGTLGTLYQRRLTNRVLRAAAAVVLPSSSKYTSPLQFVLIGGKSLLLTMRLSSYPAPLLYYVHSALYHFGHALLKRVSGDWMFLRDHL